jgi:hypothetical protein
VADIGRARRARTIAESLRALTGVIEADASVAGMVRVEYDHEQISSDDIRAELTKLGAVAQPAPKKAGDHHAHDHAPYQPEPEHAPGDGHDHAHGGVLGPNTELIFALACGALLAIGFGIEKLVADAPEWLPTALYIGAYGFGGFFTLREAIDNLRLKKFEIDALMLVAAAGAAALGAFAEGALLLFLFSLGHALEHYARGRAKRAIGALTELAPRRATVRRADGATSEVPVEDLKIGEVVVGKPDERVAADGFVIKGTTVIDQTPVTGESIPVDKRPVMGDAAARANPDRVDAAHRVTMGRICDLNLDQRGRTGEAGKFSHPLKIAQGIFDDLAQSDHSPRAIPRQPQGVDGAGRTMRQQRQPLLVVQIDDEAPQVRHVARHPLGPCLARLVRPRRQGRVLDPVRMAPQRGHGRTNLKAAGLRIAVEQLRGQRVGQGDQRHIGPLAAGRADAFFDCYGAIIRLRAHERVAVTPT